MEELGLDLCSRPVLVLLPCAPSTGAASLEAAMEAPKISNNEIFGGSIKS